MQDHRHIRIGERAPLVDELHTAEQYREYAIRTAKNIHGVLNGLLKDLDDPTKFRWLDLVVMASERLDKALRALEVLKRHEETLEPGFKPPTTIQTEEWITCDCE